MINVSDPTAALPRTDDRLIALLIPVPTVSCLPSTNVTAPRVIAPVAAPPTTALSVTVTPVSPSPKVIVLAPVVAATVPAILIELGAKASTPAVKVSVSPLSLPKVKLP